MRLTDDEIAQHLNVLRIACDPASPFYRRVNFGHDGGLLTLPIPQQQQVFDAICPALMAMVEASGLPAIQRDDEGAILSASLEAISNGRKIGDIGWYTTTRGTEMEVRLARFRDDGRVYIEDTTYARGLAVAPEVVDWD